MYLLPEIFISLRNTDIVDLPVSQYFVLKVIFKRYLLGHNCIFKLQKYLQVTTVSLRTARCSRARALALALALAPNSPHRQHIKSSLASLSKCECTFIILT